MLTPRITFQESLELLPPKHQEVLLKVGKALKNFRLSGGTALMLQIRHRLSKDLDFLTNKPLNFEKIEKDVAKAIQKIPKVVHASSDQVNMLIGDVNVSFVYYPFETLDTRLIEKDLSVTKIRDIASEKAYAIGRRAIWRDYVDLYFVISKGYMGIEEIIRDCERRYGEAFSNKLFLNQLIYFEDLKIEAITFIERSVETKDIMIFFEKLVREFWQKA